MLALRSGRASKQSAPGPIWGPPFLPTFKPYAAHLASMAGFRPSLCGVSLSVQTSLQTQVALTSWFEIMAETMLNYSKKALSVKTVGMNGFGTYPSISDSTKLCDGGMDRQDRACWLLSRIWPSSAPCGGTGGASSAGLGANVWSEPGGGGGYCCWSEKLSELGEDEAV